MQSEVNVILKNEDTTFKKQFNCYEEFQLSQECPILGKMVEQAKREFKLIPDDISVRISMEWIE
mgnify:CR=1 FL=1